MKDKLGEINYNNFGSKMEIIEIIDKKNVIVSFVDYNYKKKTSYYSFKNGGIKCPYEPRFLNIGYIGEGKYNYNNSKKAYQKWNSMLNRCYNPKRRENRPKYKECSVCDEWLNFQNFAKWFDKNYYEVINEKMCLDKDILVKGNKMYSPDTCVFVPNSINVLFEKSDKIRGDYPIGVYYDNYHRKFGSKIKLFSRKKFLGYYNTPEEAFNIYKQAKENYIKEVANLYKDKIPKKLYDAMYNYKVEITD